MVLYTFVVSCIYELKINPTSIEIADKYVDTLQLKYIVFCYSTNLVLLLKADYTSH